METLLVTPKSMFKKLAQFSAIAVSGLAGLVPFVSSAQVDLTQVYDATATGTVAATGLLSNFGLKGILIIVALIAAGVVIYFIKWGAHKGLKAMNGRF